MKKRKRNASNQLALNNGFIDSRFNFTLLEIKTLFVIAHKIQRGDAGQNLVDMLKDPTDKRIYYSASDIGSSIGLDSGHCYKLEVIIEKLMKSILTIREANSDNWEKMTFLTYAKYQDGILEIEPNQHMLPFYKNLTKNFTMLELETIMKFKSLYSTRIYMLIKQYRNLATYRNFDIDELKALLNVSDSYKTFQDFKVRVLDVAKKELNEKIRGLNFDINFVKLGRRIKTIKFIFNFDKHDIQKKENKTIGLAYHFEALECYTNKDNGHSCIVEKTTQSKVCQHCIEEIKSVYGS